MPSVLFDLPDGVSTSILCWLGLRDICKLDSATCSRLNRPQLLQVAYSTHSVWTHEDDQATCYTDFIMWCIRRGIRLDGINITPEICSDVATLEAFFALSGPVVKRIRCECELTCVLIKLFDSCKGLISLDVSGHPWINAMIIARVMEHCPKLKRIVHRGQIEPDSLKWAFRNCANLKELAFCESWDGQNTLHEIVAIPTLEVLNAQCCYFPVALQLAIGRKCPKLRTLLAFPRCMAIGNARWRLTRAVVASYGMTDAGMQAAV